MLFRYNLIIIIVYFYFPFIDNLVILFNQFSLVNNVLKNTSEKYGLISKLLHWLSAVAIIGLYILGKWMEDLDYYDEWYRIAPDYLR